MPAEAFDRADEEQALGLDPETLDPAREYRWIHKRKLAKRRAQGYRVELRSEHGVKLLSDDEESGTADDQIHVGDLFLASCEKTRVRARIKARKQLADRRLGVGVERFRRKGRKLGVRTLEGKEGDQGL